MKIILAILGIIFGIYLSYEYPHIARQIWDMFWHYVDIAIEFVKANLRAV